MTRTTIFIAAGLALAALLPAAPAHALRARVFVSKTGADVGACSFNAPCQSLDYALNGVALSGEITILDSGGYNPITITKGVTITVPPGVEAGIAAPAGGTAITINATQIDAVVLRGLTLSGANTASYGIFANTAGKIEIIDSVIRDFSQVGINIELGANTQTLIHISNTKVMNNANTGLMVDAVASGASATANFDHLTVIDNNKYGIAIGTDVNATVVNSNISNNGLGDVNGCNVKSAGTDITHQAVMTLQNVTLMGNDNCSILQSPWTSTSASNVLGTGWQQGAHAASSTDGTNIIGLPPNIFSSGRD